MYCPQCGQQQVSEVIRFCSRCGFPLDGVAEILASGGILPVRYVQPTNKQLSPRSKGVRQGALLMLSTLLIVPLIAILSVFFLARGEIIVPIAAISLFVGGLLRIFYALLMEDATAPVNQQSSIQQQPQQFQIRGGATPNRLPAGTPTPVPTWRSTPNSSEIYQPPSITENTTRLLDKDDRKNS
jgi:hypothetical protein